MDEETEAMFNAFNVAFSLICQAIVRSGAAHGGPPAVEIAQGLREIIAREEMEDVSDRPAKVLTARVNGLRLVESFANLLFSEPPEDSKPPLRVVQ